MKIYTETSLRNFEPWSGACKVFDLIEDKELDTIEEILEELYPDGMSETELNDFFWFDSDTVAQWLGYEDYEQMLEARG